MIPGAFSEGNTALVIAGTRAEDTQRAIEVVKDGTKLADVTDSSARVENGNVVMVS